MQPVNDVSLYGAKHAFALYKGRFCDADGQAIYGADYWPDIRDAEIRTEKDR